MKATLATFSAALAFALLGVASVGCYRHTVIAGTGAATGRLVYDHWENFWIIGLIGDTRVEVAQMCPSGNATIEARRSFLNTLVAGLTSGIYTPTTLRVRCQDGRVSSIALQPSDVRRIVSDERFADWVAADAPERLSTVEAAQSSSLMR